MTERPILFAAPMVRAVLDDTKGQTRRVLKLQPPEGTTSVAIFHHPDDRDGRPRFWSLGADPEAHGATDYLQPDWVVTCPYGQPGDRLWVREAWACLDSHIRPGSRLAFRANTPDGERIRVDAPWRPSIHMPRWASRINLEITGVRVERLKSITEADALAEGIEPYRGPLRWLRYLDAITGEPIHNTARDAYLALWDAINGAGSAATNPWVWAVTFRRLPT